jgi:hypothetical protein
MEDHFTIARRLINYKQKVDRNEKKKECERVLNMRLVAENDVEICGKYFVNSSLLVMFIIC